MILHVDMDAFFAAIEERDNPHFQGKPIVIGADPMKGFGRGVVSTANYEARKYGIHSALPISFAYRLNPKAIFLPVDMPRYKAVSERIMDIVKHYGTRIEQVSVDEAYLELNNESGIMNYEWAAQVGQTIKREIWEKERLTCSIGIGPNKLIAKIASDHQKPDGLTIVPNDKIQAFLDPKPVRVLPGVGPKTHAVLNQKWGIKTVLDLRKIPKPELVDAFGKNGQWIWEIAHGKDERIIEEEREIKSVGRQTTFLEDTNDSKTIFEAIFALLEETFRELKEEKLLGKTLTVIVRYAGFETHTSQKSPEDPLSLELAKKIVLKLLLPYLGKRRKIRLVGIRIKCYNP